MKVGVREETERAQKRRRNEEETQKRLWRENTMTGSKLREERVDPIIERVVLVVVVVFDLDLF